MIDTEIRAYLLSQVGVTGVVGAAGVYVESSPQSVKGVPYCVVMQDGGQPEQHAGGDSGLRRADVTVECYGPTDVQAGTLADAVETALTAKRGTFGSTAVRACLTTDKRRSSAQDRDGGETGDPSVTITCTVWYRAAA